MGINLKWIKIIPSVIVMIGIFLLLSGCEELLNEALSDLFTVEETVIENETVAAEGETIPVVDNYTLTKNS